MMILTKIKENKLMFVMIVTYLFLMIFFPKYGFTALDNSIYYLIEMIQIMPVIFILTAVIEAWIPKETITKRLGNDSGIVGSVLSFVLGSISAGPIYAAFPIGIMLLRKGASIRNIVIILSSWAVIKVPMLANEAKFLGIDFMILRWILTVIAIFIMSNISSLIVKKEDVLKNEETNTNQKLAVNDNYCIGCKVCVNLEPQLFTIKDSKAFVGSVVTRKEITDNIKKAIKNCPTNAIKFQ